MKNLLTFAVIAIVGFVINKCAETYWVAPEDRPVASSPSNPIDMIEPQGFPSRDNQNAQTNQTNAQAEVYRAQAEVLYAQARDLENRAILYPAEAEVLYAQAYSVRTQADATMLLAQAEYSKSPAGGVSIFKDGMGTGVQQGRSTAFRDVVIGICFLIIGFLAFASRKSP